MTAFLLCFISLMALLPNSYGCEFGLGCRFPCNCADDDICDENTGACPGLCKVNAPVFKSSGQHWSPRWSGPGCQIGNVHLREEDPTMIGTRVVDGDDSTCVVLKGQDDGWLWVGYLHETVITAVSLKFASTTNGIWDMFIGVGEPKHPIEGLHRLCGHITRADLDFDHDLKMVTKKCPVPLKGQVVSIHVSDNITYTVCELVVTGYLYQKCAPGKWGPGCLLSCNCHGICDDVTGHCVGTCMPGWTGMDCQTECPDFRWGQNCTHRCSCANLAEMCSKSDGRCLSGCQKGLQGQGCTLYRSEPSEANPEEGFFSGNVPLYITAGIAALLFILVFILLAVICYRSPGANGNRMNQNTDPHKTDAYEGLNIPNQAYHPRI